MTRRRFAAALVGAAPAVVVARGVRQPQWRGRQFHNQPADSHQHGFLVELWEAVKRDTGGRLEITTHPQNGGVPGSDPQALDMLIAGEVEFFTLMGGILGRRVPVTEIQGLPFAFTSHAQVHRVNEGALGRYLSAECATRGIHRFHYGLLENGFRQIGMVDRPIRTADDLAGVKMRVPDGEMFRDLFRSLDAEPLTVNIRELYDALKTGRVNGQENPLVVTEFNRLYEVTRYVSMTNHMWSGFNQLANLKFWNALPADVQAVVDRHVRDVVRRQRAATEQWNRELETSLRARGLTFNTADVASFRRKLGAGFYRRWRERFGSTAWSLLEQEIGVLA